MQRCGDHSSNRRLSLCWIAVESVLKLLLRPNRFARTLAHFLEVEAWPIGREGRQVVMTVTLPITTRRSGPVGRRPLAE